MTRAATRAMLIALVLGLASATTAQSRYVIESSGDVVTVFQTPAENRAFSLETGGDGRVLAAFSLGPNRTSFPDVVPDGAGGFSLFAGCDTCGRDAVVVEYEVAFRDGEYRLVGYARTVADRLEATVETCDVDLLSGRVEIRAGDAVEHVGRAGPAPELTTLSACYRPAACESAER